MQMLRILDQMAFFEGLTAAEKGMVACINLRIFKFDPRAVIIREQSQETHLFLLVKGTATVMDSKGSPLAILKAGDVVGEIAFLADVPRTASVAANTEVIAIRVDKESFTPLESGVREKLKDKLIRVVIHRLFPGRSGPELTLNPLCDWTPT
ncbi:MAG: cyclic nucleotide-binding domain-containing protein [Magnetococcales bacterium]|nr:cyclic nucleotide-binding domain-containing protein [Magnetococcales bacterium]